MTEQKKRRRGNARELKHAARNTVPDLANRPVRPGMPGGQYKPLSDQGLAQINDAVLDVLQRIGIGGAPASVLNVVLDQGCFLNRHGRLCYPKSLVEDVIAGAAKSITLHARNPAHDLEVQGSRVYYGTGGAAVKILDSHSGTYRATTINDLYDFARLADTLDNVHWFTRCAIATDIEDNRALDVNTVYACAAGTQKHLGTAITHVDYVADIIELFDMLTGAPGAFAKRPFCKLHASPMVSPLRFGEDACDVIAAVVPHGMPINPITAAQSGATAPSPLAGALVQSVAETLAAFVFVQLLKPGHPCIFSNWPFVSDLRTGSFTGGGGEEAVLNAASAQITNYYGLPSGVAAGMADSKTTDGQAGYEKALTTALAGLSGANLVYESCGMMASLLGCSLEAFLIDNEMLSSVQRAVRGIEVNNNTLALDVIEQTVLGPGHFLGAEQTIATMETEYVYPVLGDRNTPDGWHETGAQSIHERAHEKLVDVMRERYPAYISADTDKLIRERFDIRIAPEDMQIGSKRW